MVQVRLFWKEGKEMCRRESGWVLPLSKQKINPRKQFGVGGGGGEEVAMPS